MKALVVVLVLAASIAYAQPPPEPPIWNYDLKVDKADFPPGMNATRFKIWIVNIYDAGKNAIELSGYKYGMVEGQKVPVPIWQCVMFTIGHGYAAKKGWAGIAAKLKPIKDAWCKDDGPGGPGAVAAAIIADAEAIYINRHGAKARSQVDIPDSQLKEISGRAATLTITLGTAAAFLFIFGSLIAG
jgi:hypothetical protein